MKINKEWLFTNKNAPMSQSGYTYELQDEGMRLLLNNAAGDAYLSTTANYTGNKNEYIEIVMKNTSENNQCQIFHNKTSSPSHGITEETSYRFSCSIKDTEFKTYYIPCTNIPHWGDEVFSLLRFDLANGTGVKNYVWIQSIRIIEPDTINVHVDGQWKKAYAHVHVNGSWKKVLNIYTNVDGTWRNSK